MTIYFLKDQGSLSMVANTFGIAINTVSVTIPKVCCVLITKIGPLLIKLPQTDNKMKILIDGMERKHGFPQAFGCIDGTHVEIQEPQENPHDYWLHKMKYSLNIQAVCDHNGVFVDVDARWPGCVKDAKIFANSSINTALRKETLPQVQIRCLLFCWVTLLNSIHYWFTV